MIIEELLHAEPPVDTQRLLDQQARDREQRNAENLTRWHVQHFGPVVGPQLVRHG